MSEATQLGAYDFEFPGSCWLETDFDHHAVVGDPELLLCLEKGVQAHGGAPEVAEHGAEVQVPDGEGGGAEADGGMDAALDRIYEALSECAALNPDPDASDDEESEGEGEGEEEDDELLDPQALLGSQATPEQLAMLARYDAMIEASGGVPMDNADGRYDDPEEEGEQEGGEQPPRAAPTQQ